MNWIPQIIRILIMLIGGYLSYQLLVWFPILQGGPQGSVTNMVYLVIAGVLTGYVVSKRAEAPLSRWVEQWIASLVNLSPKKVMAATVGTILSLLLSVLLNNLLSNAPFYHWGFSLLTTTILAIFFIFFSLKNSDFFGSFISPASTPKTTRIPNPKILDTNVIIDGRIIELLQSQFLEGTLVVPLFVLRELQFLADHADPSKRARGKRGLEVLEQLHNITTLKVLDWDDSNIKAVDDKLVRLAQELSAKLLSNDFNLGRVAKLQDVDVLNLNALATAIKARYNAGDVIQVSITKEGQQAGQGVAYLEDGTMVVVEDGAAYKGQMKNVVVLSNIQTNVGRMIFARTETN
ncbi:PIN/TRAM domain-containing protein [Deinococcus cellulosilyticus]|uniref:PIN/TRAM domain-containing protein n=1 Tax=Deinococcus cellulosilyticus (strain DSM 18568 / NBRC 106333 / KACC 11606 / 5516J-15) TaxID=1223518 RepID=A0A511N6E3_DEIC1|nr:PIN/TRAM domain-containing protein [Deinococcus cellulosilyticus]GEM48006.1 PIN/TRAM domain-containing protein [Deinococcus cellulosilyticus NBRC 106333 = KACC 11606]